MTESEAIESALKKVEAQQDNFGFMDRFDVPEHWAVRKALEKQIPKKPILKHDVSVMHINRGNQPHEWKSLESDNWHCHECDSFVGERVYVLDMHHDQRKKKYCDNCGQKLDWGDSD